MYPTRLTEILNYLLGNHASSKSYHEKKPLCSEQTGPTQTRHSGEQHTSPPCIQHRKLQRQHPTSRKTVSLMGWSQAPVYQGQGHQHSWLTQTQVQAVSEGGNRIRAIFFFPLCNVLSFHRSPVEDGRRLITTSSWFTAVGVQGVHLKCSYSSSYRQGGERWDRAAGHRRRPCISRACAVLEDFILQDFPDQEFSEQLQLPLIRNQKVWWCYFQIQLHNGWCNVGTRFECCYRAQENHRDKKQQEN